MKYIGLHAQISRNNRRSVILLIAFPLLILIGVYAVLFFINPDYTYTNRAFLNIFPIVLVVVTAWFVIAYYYNNKIIQWATHAQPLERKDHMRIYNLTENLCMSVGMKMPKLYIIQSNALNAFSSGVDDKSFAITLTSGIIDKLNDEELEGVIAHEISHIRNRDVRLLIITIVFVGIFGIILDISLRNLMYGRGFRRRNNKDNSGSILLIILLVTLVLYFFSMVFKFALSRSREYMADAGAVELTKNSLALASALKKISGNSELKTSNDEVTELFIDNSDAQYKSHFAGISRIFATHPPIEKRIKILEQF